MLRHLIVRSLCLIFLFSPVHSINAGCVKADVVFLLDSSGSVGSVDFQKQLQFVVQFANSSHVGPYNVHLSLVTFSTAVRNEFFLKDHATKAGLIAAIGKAVYQGGSTMTGSALRFVRENSFTAAHGGRPNVARLLIVMTDGQSSNGARTLAESTLLHKEPNLNIYAIGIGKGAIRSELLQIAGDASRVFQVQSFSALVAIQKEFEKQVCKIDGGWTSWYEWSPCSVTCGAGIRTRTRRCINPQPQNGGRPCAGPGQEREECLEKQCHVCGNTPVDIIFLLDCSISVNHWRFPKERQFVKDFVKDAIIGKDHLRVGVATFSTSVHEEFALKRYFDKTDMMRAIDNIPYHFGLTYTWLALKYARERGFSAANGGRANATHVLVVITDGNSNSGSRTTHEADLIHQHNITIYAVGIGSGIDQQELHTIATSHNNVFTVSSFDGLTKIRNSVRQTICPTVPPVIDGNWTEWSRWTKCDEPCGGGEKSRIRTCTNPAPQNNGTMCHGHGQEVRSCNTHQCHEWCSVPLDVVFLLDSSISVNHWNFDKERQLIWHFTNDSVIGAHHLQLAVVTFGTSARGIFDLDRFHDKNQLLNAVANIPYHIGLTHTWAGLDFVRTHSFLEAYGARPNATKVLIVLTDGNSNDGSKTTAAASAIHQLNITVLAIGVGNGIDQQELHTIASEHTNVFFVTDFDALASIENQLKLKVCPFTRHLNVTARDNGDP